MGLEGNGVPYWRRLRHLKARAEIVEGVSPLRALALSKPISPHPHAQKWPEMAKNGQNDPLWPPKGRLTFQDIGKIPISPGGCRGGVIGIFLGDPQKINTVHNFW